MAFSQTRDVALLLISQLSISDTQLVLEDEPHCVDLRYPIFEFTLVINGEPYMVWVRKGDEKDGKARIHKTQHTAKRNK